MIEPEISGQICDTTAHRTTKVAFMFGCKVQMYAKVPLDLTLKRHDWPA
jgi:hypothetical protein